MGIETRRVFVCDRCGSEAVAPDSVELFDLSGSGRGWCRIGGDEILCPECSKEYDLIISRHKVELADFMHGADSQGA